MANKLFKLISRSQNDVSESISACVQLQETGENIEDDHVINETWMEYLIKVVVELRIEYQRVRPCPTTSPIPDTPNGHRDPKKSDWMIHKNFVTLQAKAGQLRTRLTAVDWAFPEMLPWMTGKGTPSTDRITLG